MTTCVEKEWQAYLEVVKNETEKNPPTEEQLLGIRHLFTMGFFAGCKVTASAKTQQEQVQVAVDLLKELGDMTKLGFATIPEGTTAH